MANIALRYYQRKIESLLENNKTDEALSHCVNIIQKYPKEIETYRKLGKIFLAKEDFPIAEKVFNIILSVFPDDFVSNIGLSFIAEQDKRMDDAIKFMEYAFEIQPANENLQDELKRLYNKRDGVEPVKIRLTRGALIKMYARSALYEQAIAEIRLGLYEKPNRLDYQITLAEMLWQSDKNIDAVETCVSIVSQLPFCWSANEILDKAFQEFEEKQEDNSYRARLIELNPYYQYMLPTTQSINDIPDIAVQIDEQAEKPEKVSTFNWDEFFDINWTIIKEDVKVSDITSSDLNWGSILDEVLENEPATPASGIDESSQTSEESILGTSKKSAFIERLQKRSQIQKSDTPIPDWINDESQVGQEDPPVSAPSEALEIDEPESLDASTAAPAPVEFPEVQDETGLVDQDVPISSELIEDDKAISSAWVSAEENTKTTVGSKISLKDTQQIRITSDDPEEILDQAGKAIHGGNYQFALKKLLKLAEENEDFTERIKELLESACEAHPQESDLWLALGSVYKRLDLDEKALQVFIRAQKQISL